MNRRMVLYMLGRIVQLEAALMVPALICSAIYGEKNIIFSFGITILACIVTGFLMTLLSRVRNQTIYAREGFVIVALAWIIMSALGALPFVISGEIPNFVDAFFETVSGFTTTGSSILTNVEEMSNGLLFWRSFTHWVGGVGVLVLVMAILPSDSGRGIHIIRAEMPGPVVGKIVPKLKDTAKILYLIYIGISALEAIFLLCGGMTLFESLVHTFGTAGTGGFGIKSDSIGSYSPYIQWVITIFMLIFGVNFNIYFFLLAKKFKAVLKSEEMWIYVSVIVVSTALITVNVLSNVAEMTSVSDGIRHSAFQVAAIITTTGYSTVDFNLWPEISKIIIFILMFVGGCAGSTAGGFKLTRIIMLFKSAKSSLKHALHPRSVESARFEGRALEKSTAEGVQSYLTIYIFCLAIILFIISLNGFDFETTITSVVTCFNNVGPGFAKVGPTGSFAEFSALSKYTLSAAMLLGRLEIYPMLLLFSPTIWLRSHR